MLDNGIAARCDNMDVCYEIENKIIKYYNNILCEVTSHMDVYRIT